MRERKETRAGRRRRRRGELFTAVSRPREQKLGLVRFHFRSFAILWDSSYSSLPFASIKIKNRRPSPLSRQIVRRVRGLTKILERDIPRNIVIFVGKKKGEKERKRKEWK